MISTPPSKNVSSESAARHPWEFANAAGGSAEGESGKDGTDHSLPRQRTIVRRVFVFGTGSAKRRQHLRRCDQYQCTRASKSSPRLAAWGQVTFHRQRRHAFWIACGGGSAAIRVAQDTHGPLDRRH